MKTKSIVIIAILFLGLDCIPKSWVKDEAKTLDTPTQITHADRFDLINEISKLVYIHTRNEPIMFSTFGKPKGETKKVFIYKNDIQIKNKRINITIQIVPIREANGKGIAYFILSSVVTVQDFQTDMWGRKKSLTIKITDPDRFIEELSIMLEGIL